MSFASVIIVNYNGKHFLCDCLSSIHNSESAHEEIILIDNASNDGSLKFVQTEFPWVKIIALKQNFGFAEANNIGARSASGRYLAFLNNDTVVTPRWLNALTEVLSSDPTVGATGSKLLLYNLPGKINSAGANITFNGGGYDIGFGDSDAAQYNIPGPRGAVCGASMMVRRDEFLALGGFDPLYFMYFEDVDLCWRYWLLGKKVMYVPASVVLHRFGGTSGSGKHSPLRVFYGTRNSMFNIIKNIELNNMIFPLCFNVVFAAGKYLAFLACLKFESASAVVRAFCSLLAHAPQVFRKRKEIQKKRKVRDSYLFKQSLVVSFFTSAREFIRLWRRS
jgi:GT2 family glycosyltransferase